MIIMSSTVLIAEDEEELLKLYTVWLEKQGYDVRAAEDGLMAYNQWDDDIDAAVLDRRMPEIYGGEVLSKVREEGYETPVAMITAVEPDLDISEMEFDTYVEKPVGEKEYVSTVEKLIPTIDIRSVIRDYVRTGIKINKLQEQHPESLLESHGQYQELQTNHEELSNKIKQICGELNEYEREQLANHIGAIGEEPVDIEDVSDYELLTIISESLESPEEQA